MTKLLLWKCYFYASITIFFFLGGCIQKSVLIKTAIVSTSTPMIPTSFTPAIQNTIQSTATSSPVPTSTAKFETEPTPMSIPHTYGVLALVSNMTNETEAQRSDISLNIKEEIYFTGGYGGGSNFFCELPTNWSLPTIGNTDTGICLLGFPGGETELDLYTPDGEFVSSKKVTITDKLFDGFTVKEKNGHINAIEHYKGESWPNDGQNIKESTFYTLDLWFPSIGLPAGNWQMIAKTGNQTVRSEIYIKDINKSSITTLYDFYVDPFNNQEAYHFTSGENVIVVGSGFPADKMIRIGIYHDTGKQIEKSNRLVDIARVAYGKEVESDSNGRFWFKFNIMENDPAGLYYVLDISDQTKDIFKPFDISGFYVVPKEAKATVTPLSPNSISRETPEPLVNVYAYKPTNQEIETIDSIWSLTKYQDLPKPGAKDYRISIQSNSSWIWNFAWCGKSQQILKDILNPLSVEFKVDGKVVTGNKILEYNNPSKNSSGWYCHYWATRVVGWKANTTVNLEIDYNLSRPINDGTEDFPDGNYQQIISVITN